MNGKDVLIFKIDKLIILIAFANQFHIYSSSILNFIITNIS